MPWNIDANHWVTLNITNTVSNTEKGIIEVNDYYHNDLTGKEVIYDGLRHGLMWLSKYLGMVNYQNVTSG